MVSAMPSPVLRLRVRVRIPSDFGGTAAGPAASKVPPASSRFTPLSARDGMPPAFL